VKKYLALILAIVFAVTLFAACGGNRTETYTYREFAITLPSDYTPCGDDMWSSDKEETDIRAYHYYISVREGDWGIFPGSLEDMTKDYVEDNHIEGELLKGEGDYYYILEEGEADEGPWTRLLLFYSAEGFWEVNFYSPSRSWAEVEEQWSSYIETIQFKDYN